MSHAATRKQSEKAQDGELDNENNQQVYSRVKRSKTQNVYEEFFPNRKHNRKFVEHSIFLPVISVNPREGEKFNAKASSRVRNRDYRAKSRREEEDEDFEFEKEDKSDSSTMEYLNQCERIIENLKKLTTISTNRISRKRPMYSRSDRNELNEDDEFKESRKKSRNRSRQQDTQRNDDDGSPEKDLKSHRRNVKSSFNEHESSMITSRLESKELLVNSLAKKGSGGDNGKQLKEREERERKEKEREEEELKREERKHKIFMKFLGKAKNRGCELHKRIAQFKMKKSAEKHSQPQPQKPNPQSPSRLSQKKK